ncbi:IQ calmodulin-binding motif protein (macronuclear) [Tetrahymena thermophila SB210]|uniref:IQ calmodulin-binding motif protein n=1 Tax=Tetrahymena thermophila (strain SB210) TaxID=312017 RepID=Q22WH0_TETTS|nr:IQ calmodulin-binding motif protein [Tetrahymena thermophila SB210]EAR89447.2 IQ calmodulin-binding motif protein [Tetrahymena thermophila SB210]|eukprot:XP_001009692.2 IQ calmodulin-binding motif protein [Tetrahymena thermophila SB210]
MIIQRISSQSSIHSQYSENVSAFSYSSNNSLQNTINQKLMDTKHNIDQLQKKYLADSNKQSLFKQKEDQVKMMKYQDRCAKIIQRYFRKYKSQKSIHKLETQSVDDQKYLQRISYQNNISDSKLQDDIKSLKMELFKNLNQLKGLKQNDRTNAQVVSHSAQPQYQSEHQRKAQIIQQFWRKKKQSLQNKKQFKEINMKKMEDLKIKYNQILEESLLQQKLQFKQVLNSYLLFIEKLMQDKKQIGEECKKYHELQQKLVSENSKLEKTKEELNKKIGDLYVEQSLTEKENKQLKNKIEELETQLRNLNEKNTSKQEQNMKELMVVKKQLEEEKCSLLKEKDQIMKEQQQLQKLISTYQGLRRRDKSRENSVDKQSSDSLEVQIQYLKSKVQTAELEKLQTEVKMQQILQQNERFIEEKQILLQEQHNFLQKEHKILEVININKQMRQRYKQLKEENEHLKSIIDQNQFLNKNSYNNNFSNISYRKQSNQDENMYSIIDNDLIEKYSKYSRNSSPQQSYNYNTNTILSDVKNNLAQVIKEERIKTLEAMKILKNNMSGQVSRENSPLKRK